MLLMFFDDCISVEGVQRDDGEVVGALEKAGI